MVLTTVATNFGVTPAASAAVGPAFTCSTATAFMSENTPAATSNTQLYSSAYGAGSVTFSPLGPRASLSYNALGYNPNDNYLYAIQTGTDDLVKIDSNGGATDLGSISGLPNPTGNSGAYYVGAFDDSAPGATFWVTLGVVSANGSIATKKAYQVDVATRTVTKTLTLTQAWDPADFTASSGFMWGLETNSRTIDRLNLTTGAIRTFTVAGVTPNSNWGAAWTLGNGNLAFASNGNGNVYQIAVTNPASANPTFTIVSTYSGRTTQANDGASCTSPSADMGIAKTGPAVRQPERHHHLDVDGDQPRPGQQFGFRGERRRTGRRDQRDLAHSRLHGHRQQRPVRRGGAGERWQPSRSR